MHYELISSLIPAEIELTDEVKEQIEIQLKYEGYIEKALQQVEKLHKMENKKIPENIDYDAISGLATEARQKLKQVTPLSIAQASRISGVNPADISILLVYIEQGKIAKVSS
jgi:tRNA uridine 5-carboxymethylaminomethyl modification enzyme